jgi:hypothetical protein
MDLQNASSRLQHGVITQITTIPLYKNYNAVTYWKNEDKKVVRTTDSIDTHCKIQMGEAKIHGSYKECIEEKSNFKEWI